MNITAKVKFETTNGDFVLGLYGDDAPISVKNFLGYVKEGFYDGLIFHRIIPKFMIQGGGFTTEMEQKTPKSPIKLEIVPGIRHEKYVLSMARTQVRDSATSQFFICTDAAPHLNSQYAAFGIVTEGFDIIDQIGVVPTKKHDVPITPVVINKAYIIE